MLTLVEAFAIPIIRQSAQKGHLGKPKIQFTHVLQVAGFVYESFAIVGRALPQKASVLEKILGSPKNEGDIVGMLIRRARARLAAFPDQPTIGMLVMHSEFAKTGLSLDESMSDQRVVKTLQHLEDLDKMMPIVEMLGAEGIGFGLAFPDATRAMYRTAYEAVDEKKWAEAHRAGLAIPERPTVYPYAERESECLAALAEYVHEFKPTLDAELGLLGR